MAIPTSRSDGFARPSFRMVFGFVVLLAAGVPAVGGGRVFYVAPHGNDAWSGLVAEPNAARTDGPWATLPRARDAVREARAKLGPQEPLSVTLRGGRYPLAKPLVLGPEDSGSDAAPVVWEAAAGEQPVLSGGRPIAGWRKGDGPLWSAEIPDVKAGAWYFRQLFVNGQRRLRARLPREGTYALAAPGKIDATSWAGAAPPASEADKRAFRFKPGEIRKDWRNLADVEVVVLQFWMAARLRIQALDEQNHVALFTGGSWRPLTWSEGYYVDNVFEGLDAPGSWYLDRPQGVLYYHPLPGEDLTKVEVVAPAAEQLVRLEGDAKAGRAVRNITLRGLSFQHTDWPLGAEGYAYPQAELPPPAAVHADGAIGCRIEQCQFQHLGAWGIELRRGCRDNAITRCLLTDLGAGGVKIGEPENAQDDRDETCRTLVSDNRFLEAGQVYLGSPAVWVGQSSQNAIRHNEIAGPVMWAISVGWTWSYFPLQRARDNVVEFNHCHDIGTGPLGSHCAIYALGTSPGTVIRNNYVHHVHNSPLWRGAGEGIILDNGCVGIRVEDNVVHDAVAGGFGTNFNCFGNVIVNNIFAYGKEYQLTVYGDAPSGKPQPKGEIFARNIVIWKDGPLIKEADWPTFNTLWDYNLYWPEAGQPVTFLKYTFDEWRAKDLDPHSLVADPLFVDAPHRNFALRPESPAFGLGFRPIDLSTVGPRPNGVAP